MGRKVHPLGFRLGVIREWQSKWYDDKHYAEFILEDVKLRKAVKTRYSDAGISAVEIERQGGKISVTVHTSRPGIVIGRGGQRVEEMRQYLEGVLGGKKIQLDIREIRQPELDAYLVARSVAEQMERRVAYRRAMKQSIFRTLQAGAKGMRIICSGRLGGVEIARRQMMHQGRVPLQTLRADIDYGFTEAHTTLGRIGVKVWIYRGDIFPVSAIEDVAVIETQVEAPPPVSAKDITMVEAVARLKVVPAKDSAEAKPADVKKPRVRKKVESGVETKEVVVEAAAKPKEKESGSKTPRKPEKKAEAVVEPDAKAEAKLKSKVKTSGAKPETEETSTRSKKE